MQLISAEIFQIDIADFQLTACRGLDTLGDLDDRVIVEIQAGDDVIGLGQTGFLFDRDGAAILVELDHAERAGIVDVVAEYGRTALMGGTHGACEGRF